MDKDMRDLQDLLNIGKDTKTATSVDKQAYHRRKVAESRADWAKLGVKQVSVYVTDKTMRAQKAAATITVALEMWERIFKQDETVIEVLGNRKPKYTVNVEMVDILRNDYREDESAFALCEELMGVLRAARTEKLTGEDAINGADFVMYHLAREYVLVMYAKAMYDILMHNLSTGDNIVPTPLDTTMGATPLVL